MKSKTSFSDELKKDKPKSISINFKRIGLMVTQPRQVFTEIESENHKADWKSPIIIVGIIILLASLMSVTSSSSSSTSQTQTSNSSTSFGFSNISPGGMQGGGPMGMGGQSQSTTTATDDITSTDETAASTTSSSSTLLSTVLSAVGALISFVLTWLLIGSLANLLSISFGGQGNTKLAIVFAAWTCIPIGIRSIMQMMYVVATSTSINAVGLSGFVPSASSSMAILLQKILAQIDIYNIWQAALLIVGISVMTKLDKKKSILIAVLSIIIVILIKSLVGLGFEKIASINVSSSLLNTLVR
ncbi:MAG: YIP1 family protein [Anaerolineaceae bacterium]